MEPKYHEISLIKILRLNVGREQNISIVVFESSTGTILLIQFIFYHIFYHWENPLYINTNSKNPL